MNDNVKKVFEILGVEPNEKFRIRIEATGKEIIDFYKIDENLNVFWLLEEWRNSKIKIGDLLNGTYKIIKLPKKKKLRDLTEEEYKKWYKNNCGVGSCGDCLFITVNCSAYSKHCWTKHKDLYSDKFLDQEIEVEE